MYIDVGRLWNSSEVTEGEHKYYGLGTDDNLGPCVFLLAEAHGALCTGACCSGVKHRLGLNRRSIGSSSVSMEVKIAKSNKKFQGRRKRTGGITHGATRMENCTPQQC